MKSYYEYKARDEGMMIMGPQITRSWGKVNLGIFLKSLIYNDQINHGNKETKRQKNEQTSK